VQAPLRPTMTPDPQFKPAKPVGRRRLRPGVGAAATRTRPMFRAFPLAVGKLSTAGAAEVGASSLYPVAQTP